MTDSQKWFWLMAGLLLAGLLWILAPILTPFLVALTLAYIGDPLVDRLEKRFSRGVSVLIVFLIISLILVLALLVLLPLIQQQLITMGSKLPIYAERLQSYLLPFLNDLFGSAQISDSVERLKNALLSNWREATSVAASLVNIVSQSGVAFVAWMANMVLIPVLTFYLLRDWDILVERIHELLPRRVEGTAVELATESDEILGAFLRGQVLVMLALGFIYSVGLWIVGVDFPLLIGLLAGLVSFVPYLGFIVGVSVASIAGLLQFQDVYILLPIAGVFGVGQIFESFILTPLLVGDKIGLHPVAVIFAVMAGGQLFGFFGILL
ncbi:MAG: AI-2E family transporter, partial [Gammaproteobacteria bacterium]|nr:AI-2E family transporter [Gammaproteobacteria bacterium]